MRLSRLRKFKHHNKKLFIALQIVTISYASMISLYFLTNGTFAYFTHKAKSDTLISSASDWWDKSDLVFPNNGTQVIHNCPPTEMIVDIKNIGLSMSKPSKFEIYYSEPNGAPNNHGELIDQGLIDPIKGGETSKLKYEAQKEGWYVFKAFQRLGYNNNYEVEEVIWSEKVKVQCKSNEKNDEEFDDSEETDKEADVVEEDMENETVIEDKEVKEEQEDEEKGNSTTDFTEKSTKKENEQEEVLKKAEEENATEEAKTDNMEPKNEESSSTQNEKEGDQEGE